MCEWHSPPEDAYTRLFQTIGNLSMPFEKQELFTGDIRMVWWQRQASLDWEMCNQVNPA